MDAPTSTFSQLARGDAESLSRLFEKNRRRLAVLVYFKLPAERRRPEDVEDVVQEVLLRAYRDLESFNYRSPGSFRNWLAAIADHVILDRLRYERREMRAGEEVRFRSQSNPLGPEPADSMTPSRILGQQERVAQLIEMLGQLPEDYRNVLLLIKIQGLTTAEAAERMGKSREAVALLTYRAVKRLRELYDR